MKNEILAYYQTIEDGSVIVGKWIKLLYERIVEGIEDGRYIFDQKAADRAIRFIEQFVRHNKGPLAPGFVELQQWQKAMISCIFGIVDEDGHRFFRECFVVLGRKQGKTLLASGIMNYCFFGTPEYGQENYCIAPRLDQSELVYSALEFTIDHSATLSKRIVKRGRKNDIYQEGNNSFVKKIAFNEKKADGYSPYTVVADEMSSWPANSGLKMYEVLTSGTTARDESLILTISSSGYVNDGPYDELIKRSTRFLQGDSSETKLLPFLYMIDDIRYWNDINELHKSLPGLGVSVKSKAILDQIAVAESSLSKRSEFITKMCNLKQNASTAWLPAEIVEKASGEHLKLEDFRSSYAIAGIDLSQTTDLTAATVIIEKNGELYVFAKFWLPAEKIEEASARDGLPYEIYIQRGLLEASGENFIDYHDCFAWLTGLVEQYEILPLRVGYDRYSAQYLVQDLNNYGYQTDDVYQGNNLWPVLQEMEGLLRDGKIHIGDNDLLKIHLLNAAIKMDVEKGRGRLVKINKDAHIDGVAALADAFTVRQKWHDEDGERLKNEG